MSQSKRHSFPKSLGNSGQALVMVILLSTIIILAVVLVGTFNRQLAIATAHSYQATAASDAIRSGVSHACWLLGQSTGSWDQAMADPATNFPALGLDGLTLFAFTGHDHFTVRAATGAPAMPYEIAVQVNAVNSRIMPISRALAFVSPATMTASLPNGVHATAALSYFGAGPLNLTSNLKVDWGPVIDFGGSIVIGDPTVHSPRKFAVTTIDPSAMTANNATDNSEYWGFASLGEPPQILTSSYSFVAGANPVVYPNPPAPDQSSLVILPSAAPYNISAFATNAAVSTSIIYIADSTGNTTTTLGSVGLHLQALILEGSLSLNKPIGLNGLIQSSNIQVSVPMDAKLDFPVVDPANPAYTALSVPACAPGQLACPLSRVLNAAGTSVPVDIVGYVYVKGDLTVQQGDWIIVGALRVDGLLSVSAGASLHVIKDDQIAHNIVTDRVSIVLTRMGSSTQANQFGPFVAPTLTKTLLEQ